MMAERNRKFDKSFEYFDVIFPIKLLFNKNRFSEKIEIVSRNLSSLAAASNSGPRLKYISIELVKYAKNDIKTHSKHQYCNLQICI